MAGKFTTYMRADGICHTAVSYMADIDLADAQGNSKEVARVSNGTKPPILVDIRQISTISKEARDHFAMKGREAGVTAIALLIKSPVSRVIGNFYLGISKPKVPTRLFTNESKAATWLLNYLPK